MELKSYGHQVKRREDDLKMTFKPPFDKGDYNGKRPLYLTHTDTIDIL